MQIILADLQPEIVHAWSQVIADFPDVTVFHGSILDCACDAIVSPANSFGFMDGGIDALYTRFFGPGVQRRLQAQIQAYFEGELLVGQAAIVATEHPWIPFVIAAPTMRVPMILHDTINPYLATRAALILATKGEFMDSQYQGERVNTHIKTIAFPGLGTGVGRVAPTTCALQMAAAIREVLYEPRAFPQTWAEAQIFHQSLYTDRIRDLQRD